MTFEQFQAARNTSPSVRGRTMYLYGPDEAPLEYGYLDAIHEQEDGTYTVGSEPLAHTSLDSAERAFYDALRGKGVIRS